MLGREKDHFKKFRKKFGFSHDIISGYARHIQGLVHIQINCYVTSIIIFHNNFIAGTYMYVSRMFNQSISQNLTSVSSSLDEKTDVKFLNIVIFQTSWYHVWNDVMDVSSIFHTNGTLRKHKYTGNVKKETTGSVTFILILWTTEQYQMLI